MTTNTAQKKKKKENKDTRAGLRPEFQFVARKEDFKDEFTGMSYPKPPTVVPAEIEGGQRMPMDIYSYELLNKRIVRITGPIDDMLAERIVAQLEFLDEVDPEHKDIEMRINSPGGVVTAGLAIYDKMQSLKSDVKTVVEGQAASMGAVLLAAGAHGKRTAAPNARIMIHQPSGGAMGQITDMEIHVEEGKRLKKILTQIMADHTGTDFDTMHQEMERDNFLSPDKAKKLGIVDHVDNPERKPRFAQSNDNTPKEVQAKRKGLQVATPKLKP